MSDTKPTDTDVSVDDVTGDDKPGNKSFTQEELNKIVQREKRKVKDHYSDYDDVKTKYDQLVEEQNQKKEAEMSELEKAQKAVQELTGQLEQTKSQLSSKDKLILRQEVLSDPKYSSLPRAYRNLVESNDNKDGVIESADKALEEFQKDHGGDKKKDAFVPSSNGNDKRPISEPVNPQTIVQQIKDRITAGR